MLKKIYSYFVLILMLICLCPSNVYLTYAEEDKDYVITQSVDEDLKQFNFDYERYYIDKELCYRPIIITFNESLVSDYCDLLYIYDPNNLIGENIKVKYNSFISKFNTSFSGWVPTIQNREGTLCGKSSNGNIKRYAISTNTTIDKTEYLFRQYEILKIDDFECYSVFKFQADEGLEYSNCLNIRLEDPHNWSYHFDEDTSSWENFLDNYFRQGDTLTDQLFYSFYIPDKWDVKDIKSIDLRYKKTLLEAYRYNVADVGITHDYYKDTTDTNYAPRFYKWNEYNDKDNYDTSIYLGSSTNDFGNQIEFIYETIEPTDVSSKGLQHDYTWSTISTLDKFKTSFGQYSEIYKLAQQFCNNDTENYFIINFDDFYYSYEMLEFPGLEKNKKINEYMKEYGAVFINSIAAQYYKGYHFYEEYVFDIAATGITYEDSAGITRTAACSVAPVMEKEGSGGGSEGILPDEIPEWLKGLLAIVAIVLLVLLLVLISMGVDKFSSGVNSISQGINLKLQRKSLRQQMKNNNNDRRK